MRARAAGMGAPPLPMATMTETTLREVQKTARAAALVNGVIILVGVALAIVAFILSAPLAVYLVPAAVIGYGLYQGWRGLSVWIATNDALAQREPVTRHRIAARFPAGNGHGASDPSLAETERSERGGTAVATETRTATRVTRFCGKCGASRVAETDIFCRSCGESLAS